MEFPKVAMVEQFFDPSKIDNISLEIVREMEKLELNDKINKGDTVAITGGSRGIENISTITTTHQRFILSSFTKLDISRCVDW